MLTRRLFRWCRLTRRPFCTSSVTGVPGVPGSHPSAIGRVLPPSSSSNVLRLGSFLQKYGVNLCKAAAEGDVDPVIGRHDEIERMIQILSKKTKNNPILIGAPGVGKTAIVEGLAHYIKNAKEYKEFIPEMFQDKVIINLDLPSMLAGAKFRGEFEERLKGVLKDIELARGRVLLYIDEIHTIAGAGGSEGAIDASNILKPALARGQLRCIGTTTLDEYRKCIEKDPALARRFQSIFVKEPTEKEAIEILRGIVPAYETHHSVNISDEAVCAAVELSQKYITDRNLPDKAVDLLDESAAKLSIAARLCEERERPSVEPVEGDASEDVSVQGIDTIVGGSGGESAGDHERPPAWDARTCGNPSNGDPKPVSVTVGLGLGFGVKDRFERGGASNSNQSPAEGPTEGITKAPAPKPLSGPRYTLTAEHIAAVVAKSTGIPVGKLVEGERESLLCMEHNLRNRIVGQDAAIALVSKCVRLSRSGLRYHDRPLGVFMLLGPTGVGKTELSKALTEFIFNDSNAMLRVDMSEYMEKHSCSRLIGAPPGYVGYNEGGLLTEAVKRRPYQVILLDEFEKAHKDVSNLLLQVFDEGRLTDSLGTVVDFRNTVIILTSNLGSKTLYDFGGAGSTKGTDTDADTDTDTAVSEGEKDECSTEQRRQELGLAVVQGHFAPEFVNRLDEVVVFNPLSQVDLDRICRLHVTRMTNVLMDAHQIVCGVSDRSAALLSQACYADDAKGADMKRFGARPLKRFVQKEVLDVLAVLLLKNEVRSQDSLTISLCDELQETSENSGTGINLPPVLIHSQTCGDFTMKIWRLNR